MDKPLVLGRSAANKTVTPESGNLLQYCQSAASTDAMLVGPGAAALRAGGSAPSFLPCNTAPGKYRTHNVHGCIEIKSSASQMLDAVALWSAKSGRTGFLTCINRCPYALDYLQLLRQRVCVEASWMIADILFNCFMCKIRHYLYSTSPASSSHPGTPLILLWFLFRFGCSNVWIMSWELSEARGRKGGRKVMSPARGEKDPE